MTTTAPRATPGTGAGTGPSTAQGVLGALLFAVAAGGWATADEQLGAGTAGAGAEQLLVSAQTLAAAAAGIAAVLAGRRSGGRVGRSWILLGAGCLAWAAGNLVFQVAMQLVGEPGVPSVADVGYVTSTVMFAAAVAVWPSPGARRPDVGAFLDGLIVALAVSALLWVGVFGTLAERPTTSVAEVGFSLAYPLGDVVVLLLVVAALRRSTPEVRRRLTLVVAGLGLVLVADLLYAVIAVADVEGIPALLADGPWAAGFAMLAVAAATAVRHGVPVAAPAQRAAAAHRRSATTEADDRSVLGAAAALAAVSLVVTVVSFAFRGTVDPVAVTLAGLLLATVLARQSWTVRVNGRLTAQLKSDIDRLSRQAQHDALTGLPNRIGLDRRIVDAGERAAAHGTTAAVMFVDLDHLKTVNDSLGHAAGDQLITTMANRLTARVGDRVTRFGGDEFVVVLDDLPDVDALDRCAEAVVADGTRTIDLGGFDLHPSVSVGAAVIEPGTLPEELLRRADIALYRSKTLGRQRSERFHPRMDDRSRRRIDLEPELRRALDHDEFAVFFQPVVSLTDGQLVAAESLLRWRHPARGLVMPGEFLAEADLSGLLGAIGERTLQSACLAFADANSRPGQHPVAVSVNLSTSELEDRHVIARVGLALERSQLDPRLLTVEITEDVVVNRTIRRTIDDLVELGLTLSIDDFGTGNSSLRQLGSYPATALKIDKSYVDEVDRDENRAKVVRAVVGLAHRFGLYTIAEGVERESQVAALQDLGCDAGQGWVFDRALPYEEFAARWLDGPKDRIDLRASTGTVAVALDPADRAADGATVSGPTDGRAPRTPRP